MEFKTVFRTADRFARSSIVVLIMASFYVSPLSGQGKAETSQKERTEKSKDTDKPPEAETEVVLLKYPDMVLPSAEELLKTKPFDWIVLKNSDVIVVETVGPRPDTLAIYQSEYERYLKGKSGFREGGERLERRRLQFLRLPLTLFNPGQDQEPDYTLETKMIQRIEYFDDLIIRRAIQSIDEGQIPIAYDLLLYVDRRNRENNIRLVEAYQSLKMEEAAAAADDRLRYTVPEPPAPRQLKSWPRFDETYQKLLFTDAVLRSRRGDHESAIRILDDLWDRNPGYPNLSGQFGQIVDQQISAVVGQLDYRQARYFLARLTARDPQHEVALKWRMELLGRTTTLIGEARNAASQGDAALAASLVDRAARIWPDTPGLRDVHREFNDRFQSVRLGVLRLPGEPTRYPFDAASETDSNDLTQQKLFEPVRVDERGVRYRSTLMESWEPKDLGREVQFTLRLKRADWEARTIMTSADIHREIAARIDPMNSDYDERLAGAIERVEVQSPSQFAIFFRRLPLRLEALLQLTVSLADPESLNPDLPPGAIPLAGRQRFYEFEDDEKHVSYRRVRTQSSSLKSRNVDEIVLVRCDSWDRALQSLLRGEIIGIPHVDLKDVKGLQDDNRFFVQPYSLPLSHLIVFNPGSIPLRDTQLRRALTLALPREELLSKRILADSQRRYARITATPFATTSYGHNRLLQEPPYDPQRSAALAMAAKKQLGGEIPTLRIACSPDPLVRATAIEMIEHWRRVGISVLLMDEESDPGAKGWDMAYRSTRIVEPLTDLWPLLTVQSSNDVESLKPLPERVRRQLLDLERANDWSAATRILHRIETELLVESRYIPLWEIDEFFVTRRNLIGLPPRMMHAFHDVERWTLQSWYPQETP